MLQKSYSVFVLCARCLSNSFSVPIRCSMPLIYLLLWVLLQKSSILALYASNGEGLTQFWTLNLNRNSYKRHFYNIIKNVTVQTITALALFFFRELHISHVLSIACVNQIESSFIATHWKLILAPARKKHYGFKTRTKSSSTFQHDKQYNAAPEVFAIITFCSDFC